MTPLEKIQFIYKRNSRSIFALFLIIFSLICASLIVNAANRSDLVWAARSNIPAGDRLTSVNLVEVPVLLRSSTAYYFHSSESLLGTTALRSMSAGDLIPRNSVSRLAEVLEYRSVPVQIAKNDLPNDLVVGERVDIYALPARTAIAGSQDQVVEVAHGIVVESIDTRARELGGSIGIVVRMRIENVLNYFSDTANARIVVVRNAR